MDISFLLSFAFHFFSQLFVRPPQKMILAFSISFSWGRFWSWPPVQCYKPPSKISRILSIISLPWINLSLPLYNHKGFDLGHPWMASWFSLLSLFKSEFCNKELMIWATVRSWSSFCSLYRATPSLAAKNITSLILILTIWWCPCVESSLVLLEEDFCSGHCISWQNSFSLCPASFCIPRAHLPLTPGISWLPNFALQSPMMKQTSLSLSFFFGVSSRRSCMSS